MLVAYTRGHSNSRGRPGRGVKEALFEIVPNIPGLHELLRELKFRAVYSLNFGVCHQQPEIERDTFCAHYVSG